MKNGHVVTASHAPITCETTINSPQENEIFTDFLHKCVKFSKCQYYQDNVMGVDENVEDDHWDWEHCSHTGL